MFSKLVQEFIDQRSCTYPENDWHMEGAINGMMEMQIKQIDEQNQKLVLVFPVHPWQLNPMHTMHGGMIATMMDMSMGCLSYALNGGHPNPTVEMQVRYLRGITSGAHLCVHVTALHKGHRLMQIACEVYDGQELMASGSASYIVQNKAI